MSFIVSESIDDIQQIERNILKITGLKSIPREGRYLIA